MAATFFKYRRSKEESGINKLLEEHFSTQLIGINQQISNAVFTPNTLRAFKNLKIHNSQQWCLVRTDAIDLNAREEELFCSSSVRH